MANNKIAINTFTDGINKDVDKSLLSNKSYLDAQNFRMITTKGNTTGSLETIKGNKLISTSLIASGQFIIGSCEIRDTIILFTTSNITIDPSSESSKKSMIYSLKINLETEAQVTDSLTVLYDDSLNTDSSFLYFSTAYPIKTIGRYETPNIQKVYWTDGYNNIRYANVAPTNYLTIDGEVYASNGDYMSIDKFEFLPKFKFTKPILKNIVGGKVNTGMIAYAYQLYISGGAETTFSALSDPIHVVSDNDFLSNTLLYKGDAESINSGKGFIIEVNNTNIGYNRLRLVRVEYSTLYSIPKISIANEIVISTVESTIQVIDTGDVLGELTIDEFNILSTELFTCQDIESKDNRLFVANISKSDFVTNDDSGTSVDDWDARAIRFKSSNNSADLYDSFDNFTVPINITAPGTDTPAYWDTNGWDAYVADHDGVNIFNDAYGHDIDADIDKCKFQKDGVTLGAEGPNIKIDFETIDVEIDDSNDNTTFYETVNLSGADLSYKNYASPWKDGKLSWQRDEVYRLFVVFGNDRGQEADPKWICDLRMPSLHDGTGASFSILNSAGEPQYPRILSKNGVNIVYTHRLYPRIYFKSFPTNATYAQIYKVKRERVDRSVVTQGLAIPVDDNTTGTYRPYDVDAFTIVNGIGLFKLVSPEINITKNISKQANDYIEYVTAFDPTAVYTVSTTGGYIRKVNKLKENIRVPFITNAVSNINDVVVVSPESLQDDYIMLDSKKFSNYRAITGFEVAKGCTGLLISYNNTSWSAEGIYYVVVNYKSDVYDSQYGGHTYEDRMNNISIPCSNIIPNADVEGGKLHWIDIPYGDIFINYFDVSTLLYDLSASTGLDSLSESVYIPLESSINCDLRHDTSSTHLTYSNILACLRQEYLGTHVLNSVPYEQEKDLYLYNTVYSQQLDIKYAISFSVDKILETEFDCMIKASNEKSNGEISESWSKFGINEFIEVDSKYGPVNALHNFNNTLYYWQDKGFGAVSVNERSLINDNSSAKLVLGTGGILDRFDYISYYVGSKDKFSVVSSIAGLFWFDKMSKSIYKYSNNLMNLTKTKYIQSYMTTALGDNFKVIAHADIHNDEILFTFFKENETNGFTISFNEPIDAFVSFYGFVPTIYIPYQHRYLTTTNIYYCDSSFDRNCLYLHDSDIWDRCYFYALTKDDVPSKYVDSTLEILFNPEYEYTKVFDSLFYISNTYSTTSDIFTDTDIFADTFNSIQCYNDFQNTGVVTLVPGSFSTSGTNIMRRERGWTLTIPRNIVDKGVSTNSDITAVANLDKEQLFKERMRDKYLIAYFTYVNDGAYDRFVVSNIGLRYRTSVR